MIEKHIRWKKTKNGFHHHDLKLQLYGAGVKHLKTITIHIMPNISQIKGNHTLKFGQVIAYNKINIFVSKIMQKMKKGDQFQTSLSFKKALYEAKASGLELSFN